MRRLAIVLLAAPLLVGACLGIAGSSAAQAASLDSPFDTRVVTSDTTPTSDTSPTDATPATGGDDTVGEPGTDASLVPVDVLQVSGLFDGIVVDAIDQAIDRASTNGSQALILQVNSGGAIADRSEIDGLIERVAHAPIPIGIWVGPSSSARLYGPSAQLMAVADVTAMVSGSRIGYIGSAAIVDGQPVSFGIADDQLRNGSLSFSDARTLKALKLDTPDVGVPTIRNMVLAMDGFETADGVVLDTVSGQINESGGLEQTATLVKFSKIGLLDQLMHTVASPPVAYLMLLIGLALLIFEFFTAGVGVAGAVGAVCAFLGCYGLAELPTRPFALAMILVAMIAFAIDVQVGIPRFWTGVGVVLVIVGSWFLFEPLPGMDLRVGWLTLLVGIGGVMLTFITGMPSMVRTRFATPTIGREWMIGEAGSAVGDIAPEGVVLVGDARWRARTNRATPLKAGDAVRVVAIDGVTLEVEPEEGAARDYRERRAKGTGESGADGPDLDASDATDPDSAGPDRAGAETA